MPTVLRIENPVAGDYIAESLEDAARFVAEEVDDLEPGEEIVIRAEVMSEAQIRALPEWP